MAEQVAPKLPPILALVTDLIFKSKMQEVVRRLDYRIRFVGHSVQLLSAFREYKSKLIILDLTMPKIDFTELFHLLQQNQHGGDCYLVAYTTHADWKKTEPFHTYVDQVVTKNIFLQNFPNLVLGYMMQ